MKHYIIQYRVVHAGALFRLSGTVRAYSEAYAMRRGLTMLIENGFSPVEVLATEA